MSNYPATCSRESLNLSHPLTSDLCSVYPAIDRYQYYSVAIGCVLGPCPQSAPTTCKLSVCVLKVSVPNSNSMNLPKWECNASDFNGIEVDTKHGRYQVVSENGFDAGFVCLTLLIPNQIASTVVYLGIHLRMQCWALTL